MSHGDSTRAGGRLSIEGWCATAGLVTLLSAGTVVEAVRIGSLRNPAVWGHLRDGMWILENRRVPRTGIFSQAVNLSWHDFSWGYDTVAAITYRIFGLRAVPALAMGFRVLVAAALFLLAFRAGRLLGAIAVAAIGLYAVSGIGPASTGASVVLFAVELLLLGEWRAAPESRVKYGLPLLFLVWANLDIGFVYGMAALALFVASEFVSEIAGKREVTPLEKKIVRDATVMFAVCLVVSGITPYGYASYPAFWQMEISAANANIPGYSAMGFRQPLDYVVLLLGMAAFLALGLRRSRDVFLLATLCGSAALAFHSQRENWLLVVSAVAAIGSMLADTGYAAASVLRPHGRRLLTVTAISLAIAGAAFFVLIPRDPKVLMGRIAQTFPVKACEYIRNERLPQPLFNAYEWGAFVMWYLPEYPVAIDGRRGLYPEELESGYFKVMKADVPYQTLPAMKDARTILLPKSNVLGGGLRNVSWFTVAYEDDVALVLVQHAKE